MTDLVVRGLVAGFGTGPPVLDGLGIDVPAGSLVAVLGASGCGKTTLLRVLAGFHPVDAGEVRLGGRLVAAPGVHVPPERRRVGVVPQEGALFGHLDVAGNVAFGLPRAARRAGTRVAELLELVGLPGLGHRAPGELSGGQQQRVALARALAPGPDLVLLDEPFSALDAGLRDQVRTEVAGALRAAGATAVLVTHDQEEALGTADLVAVLREGRVVQQDAPHRIYAEPVDLGVGRAVGEAVVLDAVGCGRGVARTVVGEVTARGAAPGTAGRLLVRPEQLRLDGTGAAATVRATSFHGRDTTVLLAVDGGGDGPGRVVTVRVPGVAPVRPGDPVRVRVDGPGVFFPG